MYPATSEEAALPPINQTDPEFVFRPNPPIVTAGAYPPPTPAPPTPAPPAPPDPLAQLGPLEALVGAWSGSGFNSIWRPHFPSSENDRFLELNETSEQLVFSPINGEIPNRGLLQADINMFGVTYLQQIAEAATQAGLHIEPGIWAIVPQTTAPAEQATVVRLASIPHGTVVLAQGVASVTAGPPSIPDNNIIPFSPGGTPPTNADFASAEAAFTELNLGTASQFRATSRGVTQDIVVSPNSLLRTALDNKTIRSTTTLQVTTTTTPVAGGGTANTAFLQAGNAEASQVDATFWIETIEDPQGGPDTLQLQYSQTVMLDFNGIRWPHVTAATLAKQPTAAGQ